MTPTVTPTPQPGAGDRDLQRLQDLERIRAALEEYYDKEGSYPSTGGNMQTLCAYKDLDIGCKLTKVLDPLPAADPLGDPLTNGYWYASDGKSFAVYAQAGGTGRIRCDPVREARRNQERRPRLLRALDALAGLVGER